MRFRILGPLEVWSEEGWRDVSAAKWRSLLACLLIRVGQIVSTESLIFELWGDSPPARANNLVSIYVHRLRKLIGDSEGRVLVYRAPGYLLRVGPDDTDMRQFESLVAEGRGMFDDGGAEAAAARLEKALALWRGPLLADVLPSELVSRESERTAELRLIATELWTEANLACGRFAHVIPELRRLVAENPLREGLWLQLMRALEGAGRHAEALEAYGQAREAISEELGVDPGAELHRLYAELLAAAASGASRPAPPRVSAETPQELPIIEDRASSSAGKAAEEEAEALGTISAGALAASTEPGGTAAEDVSPTVADDAFAGPSQPAKISGQPFPRPTQLPADIEDFTGRGGHVRHLCDMLTRGHAASSPGAVPVALVAGAGGLGKTTLAVHAAHRIKRYFPDGQLYADLLGATAQPASPGDVLARFLRDLGVDGNKVPVADDERAALYRTTLTGRQMLIVLDNARDAAQVRPLLPGSESCAVLVTARNRMPDLASTRYVDLNVLGDDEALALFTRIVGDERPEAEPDATAEVLLACAGLPLAIRICAARLAARSRWKIATMASRLRNEQRRLDELKVGDLAVRASFQVSYASLRAPEDGVDPAKVFRLLGLWQGSSISLPAAAALLGQPEEDVADALESLVDVHLLESPDPDRYRFHDLLRVYAAERVAAEESQESRATALHRLFLWYLHTMDAASQAISPNRHQQPLTPPPPESRPLAFADPDTALDWCEAERENLVAATRQAAAGSVDDVAWQLPAAAMAFYNRRGYRSEWITTHQFALDRVRRLQMRWGEALTLNNLGMAYQDLEMETAVGYLEQALAIRREIGDLAGEAQTVNNLLDTYLRWKRFAEVVEAREEVLLKQRQAGYPPYGVAIALNNVGEAYLGLGNVDDAISCLGEARKIFRDLSDARGEAITMMNLGAAYLELKQPDQGLDYLRQAVAIHHAGRDRRGEATALNRLGDAYTSNGYPTKAHESLTRARAIFEDLGDEAQATDIRLKLQVQVPHP
jgi:DNA-binding SARP family transcriptional activator